MTAPELIAIGIAVVAAGLLLYPRAPRVQPVTVAACDDCTGGPGCPCADGLTDATDCNCPIEGGMP